MKQFHDLPDYAQVVVKALLETRILRDELSGYDLKQTANQIKYAGEDTALTWDGKSVAGKVAGTEARIFLVLKDVNVQRREFPPRLDVKVDRSLIDEAVMLTAFKSVGVHDFKLPDQREPEKDAIIESPTHDKVDVANISDILPWYITYTTRAILGVKHALRGKLASQ